MHIIIPDYIAIDYQRLFRNTMNMVWSVHHRCQRRTFYNGNTSEYLVIIVVIDGMKFQMSDHFIEHKKKQIHCEEETIHD
jgi:hypothetical protein